MHITNWSEGGWWPLQDHDPSKELEARECMGAVRLHPSTGGEAPQSGGAPGQPFTYGDIQGGLLWLTKEDRRKKLHSWYLTPPAVVFQNPPAGTGATATAVGFSGVQRPGFGQTVTKQEAAEAADSWGWKPIRYSGAELSTATGDDRYQPKRFGLGDKAQAGGRQSGFPSWMPEGYAFPTGWTGQISSGSDEKGQYENLHPDAWALFAGGHGTLVFSVDGDYRPDKFGRLQSLVQVVDAPVSGGVNERPLGLVLDPFVGGPTRAEGLSFIGGNGIGFGSGVLGGPFVVPAVNDFHNLAPGLGPLHLNVDANWISATVDSHDGPFDQTPGDTEGYRRKVNFGKAKPNGANPNGETAGWGWEVFVPYFEDGEGEGRTQVRGGGSNGVGGVGGAGGGGGGGGGGKPPKRGGGGGGDTPPGSRTIVLTDDIIGLSPIGKPGVNMIGRPGGPIPAVAVQPPEPGSAPGRGPPVVGGLQKPKKLNIPQTIATTGLAIKATSQRAGEFDPTSSSAPMSSAQASLYEAAPTVALFAGYGQGDGSWGGFVNATHNTPQTAPTANGGVVVLPPGVGVRDFLAGTAAATSTTTMVMAQGYTSLGFGKPVLSTGGASGVKMTGDAAGVKFTNHDSTGTLVAGADFRFGEAGFLINGKIDHNGRLDPWSVEFTDRSPEDIPNGAAGFFWSTDDTEFPGIDGYRPLWKRPDDNSIEEIAFKSDGGASLPKRYVEGLVIRYASTSTITVSAGKARDKADGADMTLAAEVTTTTSGGVIQGVEQVTVSSANVAVTSGSAVITGTGTTFRSQFKNRALAVGTIGTGGAATTTITGSSTKFLSEVAVGDMIGTTTAFSRVTAIASDTSLTVVSNLTIANGTAGLVVEGSCVGVSGISAANGHRVMNGIDSDTQITCSATFGASTSSASLYHGWISTTHVSQWLAVWLVSGSAGTGTVLSQQRTVPYTAEASGATVLPANYTTSYRRIGWVRADSSGNVYSYFGSDGGNVRMFEGERSDGEIRAASNLASTTSWQDIACAAMAPPTARALWVTMFSYQPNTVGAIYLRGRAMGDAAVGRAISVQATLTTDIAYNQTRVNCDGAQYIQHGASVATTGDGTYVDIWGYEDTLE